MLGKKSLFTIYCTRFPTQVPNILKFIEFASYLLFVFKMLAIHRVESLKTFESVENFKCSQFFEALNV